MPVLSDLVRERGAVVVLDRRDVFLSADAIDITDEAIARLNTAEPQIEPPPAAATEDEAAPEAAGDAPPADAAAPPADAATPAARLGALAPPGAG